MNDRRAASVLLGLGLGYALAALPAQNVVPNPEFAGAGGVSIGAVTLLSGAVPAQWRIFAVGGGSIELEVVPVGAGEVFPGSPETNAVLVRVTGFGADQGFDDDNGRFPVLPGVPYHGEFYARSANADGSDQRFHLGFPLFNAAGVYQGIEPGALQNQTATADWQLFTGPTFNPPAAVAQGHISFRCLNDGEENAVLIALPFVGFEGTVVFPTNLACRKDGLDVELSWVNHETYAGLKVLRDGAELAALDAAATSYRDVDVPDGAHTYQVLASFGGVDDGPSCDAAVFRLPIGEKVRVDLGEVDVEEGVQNNTRGDGGDGETGFVICGPDGDLREARSNFAGEDPTPDFPDPFFYFNVTDPAMKGQAGFRIEATVYDDPALAGVNVFLQYTTADSTGPADIPNTFFPLAAPPTQTLAGTGNWTALRWDIGNAGFRSYQQGQADFRLGVAGGARLCMDSLEVIHFPVPTGLSCRRVAGGVALAWENGGAYDAIKVFRDGTLLAELPGGAASHLDGSPPEGVIGYQVVAVAGPLEGGPSCSLTIFFVPPGTRVRVDLGETDVEEGLQNTVRLDGTDGENEFLLCGPEADLREARSNYGGLDPTVDFPDPLFYFTVTDPPMKAQPVYRLEATVFDDPARAGVGLYLQYTNVLSTGPGDIPNTFFPLAAPPVRTLGGTGEWTVLEWDLEDAGFRSFQQGQADFRIGTTDAGRVCLDKVELVYPGQAEPPAPPAGLVATAGDRQVSLDWQDGAEPDLEGYNVYRSTAGGGPYEKIAGPVAASAHVDAGIENGTTYYYVVRALGPGGESGDSNQASATPGPERPTFRRGDVNVDGKIDVTDPVNLLGFLFLGGTRPECLDAGDTDDSGLADISDAVSNLGYQFLGSAPPADPGPIRCGPDPTPEAPELGCEQGCG